MAGTITNYVRPSATPYTPQPVYLLIRYRVGRAGRCGRGEPDAQKVAMQAHRDNESVESTRLKRCAICDRDLLRGSTGRARSDATCDVCGGERGGIGGSGQGLFN